MTYDARAEYNARMKKAAEEAAQTTASQESAEEIASKEEISKLPEQTGGAENVAETDNNANEVQTEDPEMPTDAENFPDSPVEPYNESETPEKLAQGVVSEIKKIETGVTQVINEDRAVGELENVAQEMLAIISEKGAMTSAESAMFSVAVQNACKSLDGSIDIASMEGFLDTSTAAYATEVSLEGVLDKINTTLNNFGLRIEQGLKNLWGLANSLTPLLSRVKKRAETVRGNVNNSNREAGLKQVSGNFVGKLSIEGRAPDAKTVVSRAAYLAQLTGEVFGSKAIESATAYGREAINAVAEAVKLDEVQDRPSIWWYIFFDPRLVAPLLKNRVGNSIRVDAGKTPELFKIFPSAAKINHSVDNAAVEKNLDIKRSETLFGEKAIVVSQYKREVEFGAGRHTAPMLTLVSLGKQVAGGEIQTLTSQQQGQVLDSVIKSIDSAINYYKTFNQRSKAAMEVYQQAFKKLLEVNKGARTFKDATLMASMPYVIDGMARAYVRGVFVHQGKIAQYVGTTGDALIALVEKSRAATQADDPDAAKAAANKAEAES